MDIDPRLQRIDTEAKSLVGELEGFLTEYEGLKESGNQRSEKGNALFLKINEYQQALMVLDQGRGMVARQVTEPARQALATGAFKHIGEAGPEGAAFSTPLTPETKKPTKDIYSALRSKTAEALMVPKENIDISSGIPSDDRARMALLPTPEERRDYILNKYRGSTVLNVDGEDVVLAKIGNKYIMADEYGFGAKDLIDAVPDAARAAVNIVGAVAGAKAFNKFPIVAASLFGNLNEQGVGVAMDMVGRKAADLPIGYGEIAGRRALLGATGMTFDIVTGKVIAAPIARRVGPVADQGWQKQVRSAYDQMSEAVGFPGLYRAPVQTKAGQEALDYQLYLASKYPNSANAASMERNRKIAEGWMDVMMGSEVDPDDFVKIALDSYAQRYGAMVDQVARSDKKVANVIKGRVERDMRQFVDEDFRREQMGKGIYGLVDEADKLEADFEGQAFQGIYNQADEAGFSVERLRLANALRKKQLDTRGLNLDIPAVNNLLQELESVPKYRKELVTANKEISSTAQAYRQEYGEDSTLWPEEASLNLQNLLLKRDKLQKKTEPMTLADLHASRKEISDMLSESSVAAGTKSASAEQYYKYLSEIISENLPDGLRAKWLAQNDSFNTQRLAFRRSSPGAILKTELGVRSMTPSQIAAKSIEDIEYGRKIIEAVGIGDQIAINAGRESNNAMFVRSEMQRAYLSKIGANRTSLNPSHTPSRLNYDPEMVEFLWGVDAAGKPNRTKGIAMVQKLDELNKLLSFRKLDAKNVTAEEMDVLAETLNPLEVKRVQREILTRIEAERRADDLLKTGLIKQAVDGKWGDLNYSELATQLYKNGRITDLETVMSKMPRPIKDRFKRDYLRRLFNNYRNDAKYGVYPDLSWDGAKLANDLARDKGFKKRLEFIFGKDFIEELNASSLMMATSETRTMNLPNPFRMTVGAGRLPRGHLATGLQAIQDRWFSMLYGVKEQIGGTKLYRQIADSKAGNVLFKDVGTRNYYNNMRKVLPAALASQEGITSMMQYIEDDPRAASAFASLYRSIFKTEMMEEEGQNNQ